MIERWSEVAAEGKNPKLGGFGLGLFFCKEEDSEMAGSVREEEKSELRGRRLRVKDKKELGLGFFFCSFSGVSQNCPPYKISLAWYL